MSTDSPISRVHWYMRASAGLIGGIVIVIFVGYLVRGFLIHRGAKPETLTYNIAKFTSEHDFVLPANWDVFQSWFDSDSPGSKGLFSSANLTRHYSLRWNFETTHILSRSRRYSNIEQLAYQEPLIISRDENAKASIWYMNLQLWTQLQERYQKRIGGVNPRPVETNRHLTPFEVRDVL
jgi:hypothetical protein